MAVELGDVEKEGMFRFTVDNVREALPRGLAVLLRHGEQQPSRNGDVITYPDGPVATTYRFPVQRVLLNPIRDANPFFHLIESMWMLAGRNDGTPLDFYVKGFSARFGHNGIIPDAYGDRWRYFFDQDQLVDVVEMLKADINTRQAVLQMWDPTDLTSGLAKPCNLSAIFRQRHGYLDMTVFNRSNDILLGAYGANAVHFSFLHEYICAMVEVDIGQYTQISNDFHMYVADWERLRVRARLKAIPSSDDIYLAFATATESYELSQDLVHMPRSFDASLTVLWGALNDVHAGSPPLKPFRSPNNPFLESVYHMACAYHYHKQKDNQRSSDHMVQVKADDWRTAGMEWLTRRWIKESTRDSDSDKIAV